ncbi:L-Ala-D/L-Glu epimerase [Maioricimonas rarisocia]|uniref:L-Ala-D/L-Glu epimerase n=1 Tax=Maioricimonas rarisocia TaxID=2528026 RepID=A0A517Z4M5_9PLAN|nr:enolase C-terminal domain-like protein [Maioricimonas rarisocia]QDU37441.1 L-Ala-D/L-Glu epimerase [Maioricimonas rarisocia]
MKITKIDSFAVRIPLKPKRRMISALGQQGDSEYLLVRVETDAGIEGAGEATVMARWSGETVWSAQAMVDRMLAPKLIGLDPRAIEEIDAVIDAVTKDNWFAKSAIEMACWDIAGKDAGKPVYDLLDGPRRSNRIECRFSMGAYPLEQARTIAEELVEAGFRTIKVKVGTNVAEDIARVKTVREVIGPDRALVIDANGGWDAETAIAATKEMQSLNVSLFEQPTPRHEYAGLARVREETGIPVMADDTVFDLAQAQECLRNGACDVISVYPGKNGGIRKSRQIAEVAAERGVACSIGSNLEWDVASAAMCHLVVGTDNLQVERFPGDILGPEYHEFSIVKNPLTIEGPFIETPTGPGLGVEVDWGLATAHSV